MDTAVETKSPVLGYVLIGIGAVLAAIGLIWGVVVGFYASDLPLLLGLLAVGAGLLWFGQRLSQAAKRSNVERRIADRDATEQ
ncbi:hypothetical protein SRABI121_02833 [Microbacterium sp. Bi121]|nr:hypothetical protein SRABI121_02833 [Microbacterium sp. Bi121]